VRQQEQKPLELLQLSNVIRERSTFNNIILLGTSLFWDSLDVP
jgi:hypothetical protein